MKKLIVFFIVMIASIQSAQAKTIELNYIKTEHFVVVGKNIPKGFGDTLESLFEFSSNILDQHTNKITRVLIVHNIKNETGVDINGAYSPDQNTIFVRDTDVNNPLVLVHEITHTVTTHYFVVPISNRTHEILAGYVQYEYKKTHNIK